MRKLSGWNQLKHNRWLEAGLVAALAIAMLILLWRWAFNTGIGETDFRAYWSAAYLVRTGQNAYDPQAIATVQHTLTRGPEDLVMMTWNPPTLLALLLPVGYLPFREAVATWFVVNVTIVLICALLLARLFFPHRPSIVLLSLFCLFAITFPQVLTGIAMGQVTFVVLLSLVLGLWFAKHDQWFLAGAALIGTSIKPHIAILAVIYLLALMAFRRRWMGWLGLAVAGIVCALILFVARPSWLQDFFGLTQMPPVNWQTPTLGGVLASLYITEAARYMIVLLLPVPILLARSSMPEETAVAGLVLLTLPTTFFGWSYDQSLLLIPAAEVFGWIARTSAPAYRIGVGISIVLLSVLILFQRMTAPNEIVFVWVPIAWAALYLAAAFARQRLQRQRTQAV